MRCAWPWIALLALGCQSVGPASARDYRIVRTADARSVTLEEMAQELGSADVVFLGEEHDNDVAHELQLRTTQLLAERRNGAVLSLEMFERDVQAALDRYLRGEITEEAFLAQARPWGNYRQHYRPAVEWMRERGWPVLAANVPRSLASRVSKEGLAAVAEEPFLPLRVDVREAEYHRRFAEVMRGMNAHASDEGLTLWYRAQCVKDDAMAQSIAHHVGANQVRAGDDSKLVVQPPLVVHWCGKFHSDYGLGTVERLRWRCPDLDLRVVSTVSSEDLGRELSPDERARGEFVWLVPKQPPAAETAKRP